MLLAKSIDKLSIPDLSLGWVVMSCSLNEYIIIDGSLVLTRGIAPNRNATFRYLREARGLKNGKYFEDGGPKG
jgi:hypothetical protein